MISSPRMGPSSPFANSKTKGEDGPIRGLLIMAEMPETVSQLNSLEESLADYQRGIDTGKNPDSRAYLERAAELARAAALLAYPVADTGGGRGPPEGGRFPDRVG